MELLDVDRHRARFEPRSIERAIDEREELEGVGVDLADRVLVRRRDRSEDAIPEHVSIAEDDAERAPHLVRHGAEEGRLQGNDLLCRSRATLRFAGARGEVPIAERGHEEERDPQQCGRGPRDPRREDGEVGDGGERGTERRQLEPTAERGEEDHEEEHEEEVRPRASADPEGRGDQRRVRRDQDGVEGRVVKGRLREPHQDEVRGEEEGDAEARTPAGRVARAEEHEIRQRDRHHPAEDHDDPPLVPCQHRQPHTPARTRRSFLSNHDAKPREVVAGRGSRPGVHSRERRRRSTRQGAPELPRERRPRDAGAIHSTLDVLLRRARFASTELSTMPLGVLHGEPAGIRGFVQLS